MPRELTPEDAEKALVELSQIGAEENKKLRGKIPETLGDVLVQQLRPSVRTAIAKRLIEIALGDRDRDSLAAIKEIFDRIEGRTKQADSKAQDKDSTLLGILADTFKDARLYTTTHIEVLPGEYSEVREDDLPEAGD